MELTGPQFTGKHAAPYNGHIDLQKRAGNLKPATPYVAKHKATSTPTPAPKPPTSKPPTKAQVPTRTDKSGGGTPGKPGDARNRQHEVHRMLYHTHTPGMTETMSGMVGFQGDAGRTVA